MIRFIHSFAKTNDKELCRRDPLKWYEHTLDQSNGAVHLPLYSILERCIYAMDTCTAAANLIHFFNYIHMFKNCTLV